MSNTLSQNPVVATFANATSASKIFDSAGTNPSLYVASVTAETNTPTITVSDDKNSGNYAPDVESAGGTGAGRAGVYSQQNTSTGTATVTAVFSVNCFGALKTYELTGAPTSSALDSAGANEGGTGTARTLSLTINTANCSVISAVSNYPNTSTADTNYTAAFTAVAGSNAYHFGEYRVDAGGSGGITLTYSEPGTDTYWTMAAAAYKTSGAAPATTTKELGPFRIGGGIKQGLQRRILPQRFPDVASGDPGVPATIFAGADISDMQGPARRRLPQKYPGTIIPPLSPGAPTVGRGFRAPGGLSGRFRIPQRYPDTVTPPTIINAGVGGYTWAGKASPLSVMINAGVGGYTWAGKASPLSVMINASVGSYTWQGKTSPLSAMINASVGAYTWQGRNSPLSRMINASVGAWSWSGVHANLGGTVTITATPGQYIWSGVPAQIQQIITINAQIGVYSWGGRSAQITTTQTPSKGLAQYGVSFRRKRSQMDEPPDLDVRGALQEVLIKKGLIEKVEYSVSTRPVSETEEVVEVKASGISQRDLQAIVIALLASEL